MTSSAPTGAAIAATLGALLLFFRRDIPADYDVTQLRKPADAIRDAATFRAGWVVLAMLLVGFFLLDPIGVPISATAALAALVLIVIAGRGHVIQTGAVIRGAPWQVVVFSLGMYLVVFGLKNAGLTGYIATALDHAAQGGVWGATFGFQASTAGGEETPVCPSDVELASFAVLEPLAGALGLPRWETAFLSCAEQHRRRARP